MRAVMPKNTGQYINCPRCGGSGSVLELLPEELSALQAHLLMPTPQEVAHQELVEQIKKDPPWQDV